MKTKKAMRTATVILFCLYCIVSAYILFYATRLPRFSGTYWVRITRTANFIPFATIVKFISRIIDNTINLSIAVKNLLGNFVIFMPMGFFLPCISKRMQKFSNTALVCLVIIVGVETVQMFSTLGSFDVDDIILNLSGACIGYAVYKFKPVNTLLKKLYIAV